MKPEELEIAQIVEAEKAFLKERRGETGEADPLLVGEGGAAGAGAAGSAAPFAFASNAAACSRNAAACANSAFLYAS